MESPSLVVGLGNPGKQYERTRHNVGFEMLRLYAQKRGLALSKDGKAKSEFAKGQIEGKPVLLLLPMTYMNLSGEAVVKVVKFFKIPLEQVLVVFDDADMPLGKMRIRSEGGSGGHNGIKSLMQCLGSGAFARLRVGIGRDAGRDLADYVLEKFKSDEEPLLEQVLEIGCTAIDHWLLDGAENAADSLGKILKEKFNGREAGNASL